MTISLTLIKKERLINYRKTKNNFFKVIGVNKKRSFIHDHPPKNNYNIIVIIVTHGMLINKITQKIHLYPKYACFLIFTKRYIYHANKLFF